MALMALLFAHHAVAGDAEPRAATMVAGLSALERQVMLAKATGAGRIFVIAERMPPGLAAVLARVRDLVDVVRDPAALVTAIADGDRVLTFEEGLICEQAPVRTLVEASTPALVVTSGDPPYDRAERLDSGSFWAGLAIYDGRLVRTVAADLGEWDLQSTLLRSAVGEGARRIDPFNGSATFMMVVDPASTAALDQRLMSGAEPAHSSWPSRYLYRPLEQLAVRSALPTRLTGRGLAFASLATGAGAVILFMVGWPVMGLLLALLAPPMATAGAWLGAARLESRVAWIEPAFDYALEPAWFLGLAAWLGQGKLGVGAWALAGALIAFRQAASRQQRFLRKIDVEEDRGLARWLAGRDTLMWALVPFALVAAWGVGLAALAIYAAASFFLVQSRLFTSVAAITGNRL